MQETMAKLERKINMETTQEFLELYDSNYNFAESDIYQLIQGDFDDDENIEEIEETQSDEGRWSAYMNTIIAITVDKGKRYFSIDWDRGLTEYQENDYIYQPTEVVPETKTLTKTIIIWKEVN